MFGEIYVTWIEKDLKRAHENYRREINVWGTKFPTEPLRRDIKKVPFLVLLPEEILSVFFVFFLASLNDVVETGF